MKRKEPKHMQNERKVLLFVRLEESDDKKTRSSSLNANSMRRSTYTRHASLSVVFKLIVLSTESSLLGVRVHMCVINGTRYESDYKFGGCCAFARYV